MNKTKFSRFVFGMATAAVVLLCVTVHGAMNQEIGTDHVLEHLHPKAWTGDFDEMAEHRTIRFLVVYNNTFYFLDKGQQRGISYEAGKQFEELVNKKLGSKTLKIKTVFLPVDRDHLISRLVEGYGDIVAANLTVTEQRMQQVDFSNPLASNVREVPVTPAGDTVLDSADDLSGKTVYVRKSSSYYESLNALNEDFQKKGKPLVKLELVDEWLEDEDLLEMVNAGLIPIIIVDSYKANLWLQIFDNIEVHSGAAVREEGDIAWAFRKNSPKLAEVVNEFVSKNKQGTLMGNVIINRYLKNADYIKNSLTDEDIEKYKSMVDLFARYGSEYDFDFLMLVAQAYQESGLDQAKRSPAGAIGVMQVLSSTASDPSVDISDIEILENNIHAGTKYMRFLYDRYFSGEPMDELNKMLFSFAAYNAGPAKVRRIRDMTEEMGLDKNVWFQNAEIAAAKIIGRETVQYVSHIYKYYLAYRMLYSNDATRGKLEKRFSEPKTTK